MSTVVMKGEEDALSDREQLFVRLYCRYLVGARAAREAGYDKDTAGFTARNLLCKPEIERAVKKHQRDRARRLDISTDDALLMLVDTYHAARATGQLSVASKCATDLLRHTGGFEKDNRQKREGSEGELAALLAALLERGYRLTPVAEGQSLPLAPVQVVEQPPQPLPPITTTSTDAAQQT